MTDKNDSFSPDNQDILSLWIFIYSFCYTFFHILPVFLNYELKNRLMFADVFDILTPFVMIFLIVKIWHILSKNKSEMLKNRTRTSACVLSLVGAISFVEGHGMHLSANALDRYLDAMHGTPLYCLNYFFDEILGHILWDAGFILLSIGFILAAGKYPQKTIKFILIVFAAILYGFTYFVNAVEGQTVVFTFPLAILIPVAMCWFTRTRGVPLFKNAAYSFFLLSYIFAVVLFLFWYLWHKGFPEFSELGWF